MSGKVKKKKSMTYAGSGVDYDAVDAFKRQAQARAILTERNVSHREDIYPDASSRGESAYVMEIGNRFFAQVEEGLGTKDMVADVMQDLTGHSWHNAIAIDCVAMIVNDMITVGALPISVAMHLAVGDDGWFKNTARWMAILDGWVEACHTSSCVFGPGETPILPGKFLPGQSIMSGSAVGDIEDIRHRIVGDIQPGDAIVFLESGGIHANGISLARKIAEKLEKGYLTALQLGGTYGEVILRPTLIYVPAIRELQRRGIRIRYAVNITGHGWRKLMRHRLAFRYVIDRLPREQEIFRFMQKHGPVDDREAYATWNMGAGFALYVRQKDAEKTVDACRRAGYEAFVAGHIEKCEEKHVVIVPKGIEYGADTLQVR